MGKTKKAGRRTIGDDIDENPHKYDGYDGDGPNAKRADMSQLDTTLERLAAAADALKKAASATGEA